MKRILSVSVLALLLAVLLAGCGLRVPRPEIKEGEFEFFVTCELNGEIKTLSGVYVCEYDGTSWALDGGYSRDWKSSVKGVEAGNQYEVQIGTTEDGGSIVLSYGFYPEYFMGDMETVDMGEPEPQLTVTHAMEDVDGVSAIYDQEELARLYNVKIIDYGYDKPIENTFGLLK